MICLIVSFMMVVSTSANGIRNDRKYSKENLVATNALRRFFTLPKERSVKDILKYYNKYSRIDVPFYQHTYLSNPSIPLPFKRSLFMQPTK